MVLLCILQISWVTLWCWCLFPERYLSLYNFCSAMATVMLMLSNFQFLTSYFSMSQYPNTGGPESQLWHWSASIIDIMWMLVFNNWNCYDKNTPSTCNWREKSTQYFWLVLTFLRSLFENQFMHSLFCVAFLRVCFRSGPSFWTHEDLQFVAHKLLYCCCCKVT